MQISLAIRSLRLSRQQLVALSIAGAAILAFPSTALEAGRFALWNLVLVSPMIVIGIVLTAGVTASGSMALIAAAFHGRELRMIGLASFTVS